MSQIGFKKSVSDWSGPVQLIFTLFSKHNKVFRYKHRLEQRQFDFYAPIFLLDQTFEKSIPNEILIEIGRSNFPNKEIGYNGASIKSNPNYNFFEYNFREEMENSIRFEFEYENIPYSIYIPKTIFEPLQFPSKIFVRIIKT